MGLVEWAEEGIMRALFSFFSDKLISISLDWDDRILSYALLRLLVLLFLFASLVLAYFYPAAVACVSLFFVCYVFVVYPLVVRSLKPVNVRGAIDGYQPSVSVIVAACNEENSILQRIRNILELDYPQESIEIVVGSDGSTDDTVSCIQKAFPQVKVLDFKTNRGRASVHNDCVQLAKNDVLIFTDAESSFATDFVRRTVEPFSDASVGLTTGVMELVDKNESDITVSRGMYWKFEYWLRNLESKAGVLSVASGCCMAIRKSLYRMLPESTDDIDFICPLDVACMGYRNVHVRDAVVFESQFTSPAGELRSRVRMTARNLSGTLRHLRSFSAAPYWLLWSVYSHKILRWFTPFFLIFLFLSSFFMMSDPVGVWLLGVQAAAYSFAALGGFGKLLGINTGYIGSFYSFFIANVGFFLGCVNAFSGDVASSYHRSQEGD